MTVVSTAFTPLVSPSGHPLDTRLHSEAVPAVVSFLSTSTATLNTNCATRCFAFDDMLNFNLRLMAVL